VIVETAFLAFVLTGYNQRIDRLERAANQIATENASRPNKPNAAIMARF
jgi:hypothetical protein